jgi:ferredoxin
MYIIKHKEDVCIKCGACVSACDNWKLNDDGFPKPVKAEVEEIGCNKDAMDGCPVGAIVIEEKKDE